MFKLKVSNVPMIVLFLLLSVLNTVTNLEKPDIGYPCSTLITVVSSEIK